MEQERRITASEVIRVIVGERPGHNPLAQEGIKEHQRIRHNALLRAQETLDGFAPEELALPVDSPELVITEETFTAKLGPGLVLSARADMVMRGRAVIEVKPTPEIIHGVQTTVVCLAMFGEKRVPVVGGVYFYRGDDFREIPGGGEEIWPEIRDICVAAERIAWNQEVLDGNKERRRSRQLALPLFGGLPLLTEDEETELHRESVQLRREVLDPLVEEITPVVEGWLGGG